MPRLIHYTADERVERMRVNRQPPRRGMTGINTQRYFSSSITSRWNPVGAYQGDLRLASGRMLLKGVDKPSWHKRRQRQERHKLKYINEIYQIVTCPDGWLTATGY